MYDIYLVTNKINRKKYVGITSKGYRNRFIRHCSQGHYLTSAIKKYGRNNFELELITTASTKERAANYEIILIKKLNTKAPFGYNFSDGGQSPCHTEEVKLKISKKLKGRKVSSGHLLKIRKNAQIMGEKRKGVARPEFSEEWKLNMSKGKKGKSLSEKHKQSISMALRNSERFKNKKQSTHFKTNNPSLNPEIKAKIARAKWKPVFCVELNVTFLSSKSAAEYLNLNASSIATAIMRGCKLHGYTFQRVKQLC